MPRLTVFNQVSLDGFIADENGDMSWAHKQDAEWKAFTAENAKSGGALLFGRKTYDMMASFWPTPFAIENLPAVAE
jgi:dihydrofolate reductase